VNRDIEGRVFHGWGWMKWAAAAGCGILLVAGGIWYSPFKDPVYSRLFKATHVMRNTLNVQTVGVSANQDTGKTGPDTGSNSAPLKVRLPASLPSLSGTTGSLQDEEGTFNTTTGKLAQYPPNDQYKASLDETTRSREASQPPPPEYGKYLSEEFNSEEKWISQQLRQRLDFYDRLSPVRRRVLIEIAKGTSLKGLMTFDRMLGALRRGEYREASRQMIYSNWARRVGDRAVQLAEIMHTGHPDGWKDAYPERVSVKD
jgi:hypothetical protein